MTHPNEAIVRSALAAGTAGDLEAFAALIHKDFVLHVPGTNAVSGDHVGMEGFSAAFVKMFELTNGEFELNIREVMAGKDHVAGLFDASAKRDGRTFEWQLVNIYGIRDGRIADVWQHPYQLVEWNDFWS